MLRGGTVRELYEMKGQGRSIRGIARELRISRNSVRKYLRSPGVPKEKRRRHRGSKLDRTPSTSMGGCPTGLRIAWCCCVSSVSEGIGAATRS